MCRRASAGRSRAARRPPTAPETRPPSSARAAALRRAAELALDLRCLLGHRSLGMEGRESEAAGGLLHAREPGDLRHFRGGEAQLRGGEEVVAGEVRPGLAEVPQPKPRRPVLLVELPALLRREARAEGAASRA